MKLSISSFITKSRLLSIALPIFLGISATASAQDWRVTGQFGWFGVGKAHQVGEGHFYWVGEFSGTFFNDKGEGSLFHLAGVKCPAFFDANFAAGKSTAGGYCVITDLEGDSATVIWENTGNPAPGAAGPGTFEYISGTGKYAGISGKYTFVGYTQVNWADGTSSGYSTWNR